MQTNGIKRAAKSSTSISTFAATKSARNEVCSIPATYGNPGLRKFLCCSLVTRRGNGYCCYPRTNCWGPLCVRPELLDLGAGVLRVAAAPPSGGEKSTALWLANNWDNLPTGAPSMRLSWNGSNSELIIRSASVRNAATPATSGRSIRLPGADHPVDQFGREFEHGAGV